MTTTVAAGLQARVATAHHDFELVKSGWAGSGPTSAYLSRSAWRINRARNVKLVGVRARRVTKCEASGNGAGRIAEEARRSAGEAARALGRKADQVFDDVQGKAQRAAQNANLKVEGITQRMGIEEPLPQYMMKKSKEIRSEMVSTAGSVYSSVVSISNQPVVKRCLMGFLFFYAFSIAWAARILLFDKKSEEARERFGRELRLQKLKEGAGSSSPVARAPVDFTEFKVNGRKVPSGNDEEFLDKVRKIQEMARAVRVAEQEVFSPSESGFVSISGKGPVSEAEKQESSGPTSRKDLQKKKKQRKQMPLNIQDGPVGLENEVVGNQVGKPIDKLVHEPEPSVSIEPLRPPVVLQTETASAIEAEATKNADPLETLQQSQVSAIEALDSIAARKSDSQLPRTGDVVPSLNDDSKILRSILNGSAKIPTDGKSTPSTSGEAKLPPPLDEVTLLPKNGNTTSPLNGAARPPIRSQPQKFKSMRVITSPEEARARIAARKAKDGSSSAKPSSVSSTRSKFPRINVPAVELVASELGTDSEDDQARDQPKEKAKDSVTADSKSSSSQEKKQEAKSAEEEEKDWMRDEVLKNIVLKVRDNEEAGRESFHGLDSDSEQKFFKGLERKFEREGEAVKNWIQDRVENLDYGIGGVGVDDPPETYLPRWKDKDDPERAKRFASFQEDRKQILEKQMGISTPPQTDSMPSSSSSPSPPSTPQTHRPLASSSPSKPAPKTIPPQEITKKDEARERMQSNRSASGSKTIVTSTGKQAKPELQEWQHTKKWAQDLQRKYDLETDSEQRAMMEEVGQDLDRWITEDEIEEATRLLSQGLPGEEEYVRRHYERTREKIRQQHEMFGSESMLDKYSEYKETKKEVELWWLDLPYVLTIGLTTSSEDGTSNSGLYSLDMTPDFSGLSEGPTLTHNHTVAFQDQKDALNFCGLLLSEQYSADVIPMAPKDLYEDAKHEGFKVTVIKKGQLGLVPGQALDDVEQRLIEIGSSIYWEALERERSIDIDAVLDEGLGYGRPSR